MPRPSWTRKEISGAFSSDSSWFTVATLPAAGVLTFLPLRVAATEPTCLSKARRGTSISYWSRAVLALVLPVPMSRLRQPKTPFLWPSRHQAPVPRLPKLRRPDDQ